MDDSKRKVILFAVVAGLISSSLLADFYLPDTVVYRLQQACFWPAVLALFFLLIGDRKFFTFRFSRYSVALFFIIAAGLFFRLYKLNALPLNRDEARSSLATLLLFENKQFISYAGIPIAFLHGKVASLFTLPIAIAAGWFKNPEMIVRSPAIIVGLLTIWLLYRLVRELSEKKTALLAALFLAIFPWHIIQSRVGVNVILTPCFGVLFFLLFVKAVKKQSYKYLYVSFFVLGVAAFWTYTESQVFVILALMCCLALAGELSWLKKIDIVNCVLLFIVPLYPFLATWDKSNFVQSQYYHSVFRLHADVAFNAAHRLRDVFELLFLAKSPFALFAPGFRGPIIQFFLLVPLALGILNMQKNRVLARVIGVWLTGGIVFSVCFIGKVEDRHFIAVAPAVAVLFALGMRPEKFKKLFLFSASLAVMGIWIYGSNYFCYVNNTPPVESLKAYSYGSQEAAVFLSGEALFMSPAGKAVIDSRMHPIEYYFIFAQRKGRGIPDESYLDKFIDNWSGDAQRPQDAVFYCLWSPESREHDSDANYCQLYKRFRSLYPTKSPIKIIRYPDGRKAIEIFKISGFSVCEAGDDPPEEAYLGKEKGKI